MNLRDMKRYIAPVHEAGWVFVLLFFIVAVLLYQFSTTLGWIGFILTAWCAYFFRDPVRVVPQADGLIVSPADGVVRAIEDVAPPAELELGKEKMKRISIFLNVFDVHINRVPTSGRVLKTHYRKGQFLNADLDKASDLNECAAIALQTTSGHKIAFTQIAGLVARRIICNAKTGKDYQAGERFGLIRFGSRMDVYLPKDANISIMIGQRVLAGETKLAELGTIKKSPIATSI